MSSLEHRHPSEQQDPDRGPRREAGEGELVRDLIDRAPRELRRLHMSVAPRISRRPGDWPEATEADSTYARRVWFESPDAWREDIEGDPAALTFTARRDSVSRTVPLWVRLMSYRFVLERQAGLLRRYAGLHENAEVASATVEERHLDHPIDEAVFAPRWPEDTTVAFVVSE